MGHEEGDFVSQAAYPIFCPRFIDNDAELAEELMCGTLADIEEIIKVTKLTPKMAVLYTAPQWKVNAFKIALEMKHNEDLNPGKLIKTLMADPENRKHGKEIPKYVQKIVPDVSSMKTERFEMMLDMKLDETTILRENIGCLSNEIGCPIQVYTADEPEYDPENKSRFALPLRPAIYLE
jgi:leucyl-tRNA synthetase